ncbi:hypothetical protein FRC10_005812 [Ceratobasidium sp. 414]|nr:hypothetical protein FRC10_005812 [Ceratobasidium sp. 414]
MSVYPYLTQSTVGLCFIAYGVGSAVGSVVMGKILDYDWRRMEARYAQIGADSPTQPKGQEPSQLEKGTAGAHTADKSKAKVDKQDLPIEHTRLKRAPIVFFILMGACVGYGWSIQAKAPLAVPLILQFIVFILEWRYGATWRRKRAAKSN